jgi:hypothetical protein
MVHWTISFASGEPQKTVRYRTKSATMAGTFVPIKALFFSVFGTFVRSWSRNNGFQNSGGRGFFQSRLCMISPL